MRRHTLGKVRSPGYAMSQRCRAQRGLTQPLIAVVIVLVAIVSLAGYLVVRSQGPDEDKTAAEDKTAMSSAVAEAKPVTFSEHIAPIVFQSCAPCHRPGESAPFSLLSYRDAKKRASLIAAVTASRYMPPWLPAAGRGRFIGERVLADEQIELIQQWAADGALEGDPNDLPSVPVFTEGWQLGEPDLVVTMQEPYTLVAEGRDVYRNFVVPAPVPTPRWIRAVEFRPGNPQVVHHAVMQMDRSLSSRRIDEQDTEPGFGGMDLGSAENPGGQIIGWTPGKIPRSDSAMAWRLDPGTDLVFQLHLQPSGKPETIEVNIGFYFSDEPPTRQPVSILMRNDEIDILAGETDYAIEDSLKLPVDVDVVGVYPHAHYIGKEMQVFGTLPDGSKRWLIHIPNWDFNWQDDYWFEEPVFLPKGTTITMRYLYDNSAANIRNPNNPPERVRFGIRSEDEMATLGIQMLPRDPGDTPIIKEALMRQHLARKYDSWYSHNVLGSALKSQGKIEESINHFLEAIRLDPLNADPRFNLGNAYRSHGKLDDAIRVYREVLQLEPNHAKAHNNLGGVLQSQGRFDEAINHYRQQLMISPQDARIHHNLASLLAEQRRFDEALVEYRKAVALDPGSVQTHQGLADVYRSTNQIEDAMGHYRSALQIDPESPQSHYGLGLIFMESGEMDQAVEHLRAAIDVDNEYVNYLNNTAWIMATHPDAEAREPNTAVALAELINESTHYQVPELLDTLGAAYASAGQFQHAIATTEKALDLAASGPAKQYVDQFRERLELFKQEKPYRAPDSTL